MLPFGNIFRSLSDGLAVQYNNAGINELLRGCTAVSGKVNVIIIEDEDLPED